MINKITPFQLSNYKNFQNLNCKPKNNNPEKSTGNNSLPLYYVPFTAKLKRDESRQDVILNNMDSQAKNFLSDLMEDAIETGYNVITPLHIIKSSLEELDEYLDELDNGEIEYNEDDIPDIGVSLMADSSKTFISNSKYRKVARPIIKEEIAELENLILDNKPKSAKITNEIKLSEDLTDTIWQLSDRDDLNVDTVAIISAAINCPSPIIRNNYESFLLKLDEAVMTNNMPLSKRAPFSEYEKKAQNILKNLSLGTNIFVTYDKDKISEKNFIDTIVKVNENNSDSNAKIIQLNNEIGMDYFSHLLKKLAKDKNSKNIIIVDPMMIVTNSSTYEMLSQGQIGITPEFMQILNKPQASNVRFLFIDTKNNYYNVWKNIIGSNNFQEVPIPTLNNKQMIKSFKENPNLTKSISVPFSTKALERVVEASANIDGVFPQKTVDLMKNIAGYYIDKEQITENDVIEYLNEATEVFTNNKNSGAIEVVFDTGKKLKDIVGKTSTTKEAQMLVKQIKSKKMGTKGVVIYSQDGTPGSGRKYTAKAIAGEANIPYVEINTMDFGTEKVSIFDESGVSPEDSIKKIFSLVTTQAENNPNRSAVLFIENFEYFSVGEYVSRYHQKAMAQLLREMDRADKLGLNILVFGSVADPRLIGQSTMKSFKFIDTIAVETPAYNTDDRVAIIKRALKDNNIKLTGNKDEQEDVINLAATITHGFPFIYIKNLVKKAQNVALERNHKSPNKADFTEAYLQLTTGRASSEKINEHEKSVVTSHECGHATNLEIMNNLMKTQGKPWHVPDKVNFVTLDPRGFYGGAVYHGKDTNSEMSFEKVFSSIICSFGGNSAEAKFFGMDGTYGISSDMEHARSMAEVMVKIMGLGKNVGKMSIDDNEDISNELRNLIEQDERIILNNAKVASDIITDTYKEFNKEFVKKYAHLVGTGDCLIIGDEFRTMLNNWKQNCSDDEKKKIEICNKALLDIIEYTKQGIKVRKAE